MLTSAIVPAAPTLKTPSGTILSRTPSYTWDAALGATSYRIWLADASNPNVALIDTWYTAEAAGCPAGVGTCSITPASNLADAKYTGTSRARAVQGKGPGAR